MLELQLHISPSNENSGLISFRTDWLDLLAVQGTLKSLLQHYSSKASILRRSAFFVVHLSHPYMTTRKTIAFTRQDFVSFNFMAVVTIHSDFGAKKIKSVTVSIVSPSVFHEMMGPDAMILVFLMLSFKPIFFTLPLHFHQEAF